MSLLKGGNEMFANLDEKITSSTKKVLVQKIEFKEASSAENEAADIYSKYKPINAAYNFHQQVQEQRETKQMQRQASHESKSAFLSPKVVLYPPDNIEMNWKEPKKIGPGFANLGNTCFLNSVLQVLTYTAPLVNFANSDEHKNSCVCVGFCMLCEFRNHVIRVAKHHPQNGPIRPMTIIQRLSCISKNFKFGRQEDAHEFLRYVIEAFRRSCLAGKKNLDRYAKETTAINQIFGGFFRSQVTCLSCKKSSDTFDPMMELNLDIKESSTIVDALKKTVRTERLDGENRYSCERCKKKTVAFKRGNIHVPPKILTLQLKRFDFQRLFGGKISKDIHFEEKFDLSPFLSHKPESPVLYRLYAVLVHSGFSCNSGHYYCYVKAPNSAWYEMNDSRVSQVGLQTVLRAQAYLLFYSVIEHKSSKSSLQAVQNRMKSLNLNSKPNEAGKGSPVAKDVGLPVFKSEPRIVPFVKGDKVKCSLTDSLKQKLGSSTKNISTMNGGSYLKRSFVDRMPTGKAAPNVSRESSLEAIRKEYDSEAEENCEASAKDVGVMQPRIDQVEEVQKKTSEGGIKGTLNREGSPVVKTQMEQKSISDHRRFSDVEAKAVVDISPEPLHKDSPSPPQRSVNADNNKKKLKAHNGSIIAASKFGRWVPVRGLGNCFTPRSVLHRSFSDSASYERTKTVSAKKDTKRQISVQVQPSTPNGKVEKPKHWNVEENKKQDPLYGPLTPIAKTPVSGGAGFRERTSSITSETGSISTKTGDWNVHEKDFNDTPSAPYVQERHFAGWSVESHTDKRASNFTRDDGLEECTQSKIPKRLFDKHSDKLEKSSEKRINKRSSMDKEECRKDTKIAMKQRRSELIRLDQDGERNLPKGSDNFEEKLHRRKSKKSRKSKKKKRKQGEDSSSDNEDGKKKNFSKDCNRQDEKVVRGSFKKYYEIEEVVAEARRDSKAEGISMSMNSKIMVDDCKGEAKSESKEEGRKKHKKWKKRVSYERAGRRPSASISKDERKNKGLDGDDSRYSACKAPRRVALTTLSTSTESDGKKRDGLSAAPEQCHNSPRETSSEYEKVAEKPGFSRKSNTDAPVKQWDETPKNSTSWNGSNDNRVLDSLLSKKSKVTTWDDEASPNIRHEVSGSSKRSRDRWDDEYDQGNVKKVKKHHNHPSERCKGNAFQKFQNRRNFESNKR